MINKEKIIKILKYYGLGCKVLASAFTTFFYLDLSIILISYYTGESFWITMPYAIAIIIGLCIFAFFSGKKDIEK
jgi:hypothetical protein